MKKAIALSANYDYIDKVEATIKSILYNVRNVKIYLLNYDIPREWFDNINHYSKQIGSKIIDSKFNPKELNGLYSAFDHINKMTFARLLIPKLIKEDRVLYLDSDLIVDGPIDELFSRDFNGKMILAVPHLFVVEDEKELYKDVPTHQINAGVLLINNKELRKDPELSEKLLEYGRENQFTLADQEIIDRYFRGKIGLLPPQYNYQIGADRTLFWHNMGNLIDLLDKIKSPKIIHYISDDKPFNLFSEGRMRDRWWFYRNLGLSEIVDILKPFGLNKVKENPFKGEIFIFTNSEDINNLEELIKKLPDYHFNIAAWTEMAWELKVIVKYPNVNLYPNVIWKRLENIFDKMNVYLDINRGSKEKDIINHVEDEKIPVLAFEDTADNSNKYSNYTIFGNDQIDEMVDKIKEIGQIQN